MRLSFLSLSFLLPPSLIPFPSLFLLCFPALLLPQRRWHRIADGLRVSEKLPSPGGNEDSALNSTPAPSPNLIPLLPSAFKPVTGSFAIYIWVEHLGE